MVLKFCIQTDLIKTQQFIKKVATHHFFDHFVSIQCSQRKSSQFSLDQVSAIWCRTQTQPSFLKLLPKIEQVSLRQSQKNQTKRVSHSKMTVKKTVGGAFLRPPPSLNRSNMFSAGKYTFKIKITTGLLKNLEILILAQFLETNSNTCRPHAGCGYFTFRLSSFFPVFSVELMLFSVFIPVMDVSYFALCSASNNI